MQPHTAALFESCRIKVLLDFISKIISQTFSGQNKNFLETKSAAAGTHSRSFHRNVSIYTILKYVYLLSKIIWMLFVEDIHILGVEMFLKHLGLLCVCIDKYTHVCVVCVHVCVCAINPKRFQKKLKQHSAACCKYNSLETSKILPITALYNWLKIFSFHLLRWGS